MATNFSKQVYKKNENPWDTENSVLTFGIYHERPVERATNKTSLKYFLKRQTDPEHDGMIADGDKLWLELCRSVRFIENKVTSRYADNRMTSIVVYINKNKGGKLEETEPNPQLFKFLINRDGTFQVIPNKNFIIKENETFVNEIAQGWEQAIRRSNLYFR